MSKIVYIGIEAIESRYSLQLTDWNVREFKRKGVDYVLVKGTELDTSGQIQNGQVLDCHNRPYYALSQIQEIIRMCKTGKISQDDILFFEDMFHPGFEALPYMFSQLGWRPFIFVRCLAQSIDPDDFVHVAGMTEWMKKYEAMVNTCVDGVLIASHEMAAHATAAGWEVPLFRTGLPFGKDEVLERAEKLRQPKTWNDRPLRVTFAARTDQEKLPTFFLDLAKLWNVLSEVPVEFCIVSGRDLNSNDRDTLYRLRQAVSIGKMKFYGNLKKDEYYQMLLDSRVLFNCALQDWVSNTVSEADTLGCNVLYPAYRSFPEVFASDATRLYVPWNLMDAYLKLRRLLMKPHPYIGDISDAQNDTISKTLDVLFNSSGELEDEEPGPYHPQEYINPRDTRYRSQYALEMATCGTPDEGTDDDTWWYTSVPSDEEILQSLNKEDQ